MIKKLLTAVLGVCLAALALSGCGENSSASVENGTVKVEDNSAATEKPADNSEEGTAKAPVEEPEETEEEPEEVPVKDWFSEHGLVITPQGDFTYNAMAYDPERNDLELFPIYANAVITETTDGVEEGYKQVRIVFEKDASAIYDVENESGHRVWYSAFDRYTGISFAFDSTGAALAAGDTFYREGFISIPNGDESYDVSISFESENNHPYYTEIVTVTCPVDYDGAVFYIGPSDSKKKEANSRIDYSARLYTIDELPFYGDGYYFFSYSNR